MAWLAAKTLARAPHQLPGTHSLVALTPSPPGEELGFLGVGNLTLPSQPRHTEITRIHVGTVATSQAAAQRGVHGSDLGKEGGV